ncbi:MAG: serine/threonine protein kinase [Aureliella sp.]
MFPPSFLKRFLRPILPKEHRNLPGSVGIPMSLGTHLDQFRLVRCLSPNPSSKSSLVYLAESAEWGQCILKILLPQASQQDCDRHSLERGTLQTLSLSTGLRIPNLLDSGTTEDGFAYFATEYIEAPSLLSKSNLVADWPLAERLAAIRSIASLLAEIHRLGYIHNDLSPANVLISNSTNAHLIDFGIATEIDSPVSERKMITGSPAVISPEAIRREPTSTCSDIYALGCLGFLVLNGRLPYEGRTPVEILWKHLNAEPETSLDLHETGERHCEAAEEASLLVKSCMSKERSDRPASASEAAEQFGTILARLDSPR